MAVGEHDLRCPITHDYFRDPVTTKDNQVYERDAIIRWINMTGTDPITRKELFIDQLVPNEEIKKLADERRKLSVSSSNEGNSPLKSVCVNVPELAITTNNHLLVTDTRFHFSLCVRYTRFCEFMRDIGFCCFPCKSPCVCISILLIVCAVGISSILIYSIVASLSHGSS
jgi:hypothetical protein